MIRGTTPKLTFTLPFDASNANEIWLTFSQRGKEVFTLTKSRGELVIEEDVISVTLTQQHTLRLLENAYVEMQFRVSFQNGTKYDALASEVIVAQVEGILKEGVIQ